MRVGMYALIIYIFGIIVIPMYDTAHGSTVRTHGEFHALVVGVTAYTGDLAPSKSAPFSLDLAAKKMEEALCIYAKKAGYESRHIHITVLTDKKSNPETLTEYQCGEERSPSDKKHGLPPIRSHVLTTLHSLKGNAHKPQDTLVFYFTGHGADGVLYGSGANGYEGDNEIHGIPFRVIQKFVEKSNAGKKIIFVDACRVPTEKTLGKTGLSLGEEEIARLEKKPQGLAVFLSSGKNKVAYLNNNDGIGYFTTALVAGLKEGIYEISESHGENGIVSAHLLNDYLKDHIRAMLLDSSEPERTQVPEARGDLGFTLFKRPSNPQEKLVQTINQLLYRVHDSNARIEVAKAFLVHKRVDKVSQILNQLGSGFYSDQDIGALIRFAAEQNLQDVAFDLYKKLRTDLSRVEALRILGYIEDAKKIWAKRIEEETKSLNDGMKLVKSLIKLASGSANLGDSKKAVELLEHAHRMMKRHYRRNPNEQIQKPWTRFSKAVEIISEKITDKKGLDRLYKLARTFDRHTGTTSALLAVANAASRLEEDKFLTKFITHQWSQLNTNQLDKKGTIRIIDMITKLTILQSDTNTAMTNLHNVLEKAKTIESEEVVWDVGHLVYDAAKKLESPDNQIMILTELAEFGIEIEATEQAFSRMAEFLGECEDPKTKALSSIAELAEQIGNSETLYLRLTALAEQASNIKDKNERGRTQFSLAEVAAEFGHLEIAWEIWKKISHGSLDDYCSSYEENGKRRTLSALGKTALQQKDEATWEKVLQEVSNERFISNRNILQLDMVMVALKEGAIDLAMGGIKVFNLNDFGRNYWYHENFKMLDVLRQVVKQSTQLPDQEHTRAMLNEILRVTNGIINLRARILALDQIIDEGKDRWPSEIKKVAKKTSEEITVYWNELVYRRLDDVELLMKWGKLLKILDYKPLSRNMVAMAIPWLKKTTKDFKENTKDHFIERDELFHNYATIAYEAGKLASELDLHEESMDVLHQGGTIASGIRAQERKRELLQKIATAAIGRSYWNTALSIAQLNNSDADKLIALSLLLRSKSNNFLPNHAFRVKTR